MAVRRDAVSVNILARTSADRNATSAAKMCKKRSMVTSSSLHHANEQRDYILGITSLWIAVPAAHGIASLAAHPSLLNTLVSFTEMEVMREALMVAITVPLTCVSLAAWRWAESDALAATDRFFARSYVIGLLGTNAVGLGPLQPYLPAAVMSDWASSAFIFPVLTLSLYGVSATAEAYGHPLIRLWSHAAFRYTAFWWGWASLASEGVTSMEPLYFTTISTFYWLHIAWCVHWSGKNPNFTSADYYSSGCVAVATMAAISIIASPGLPEIH